MFNGCIGNLVAVACITAFSGVAALVASSTASAQDCKWQLASNAGPSARTSHALVYDSSRDKAVLFGGYDFGNRGDTWEWDGAEWMLRSQAGPSARSTHAMAYDSTRGVTVLFGGYQRHADTWEWDGAEWSLRSQIGPSGRHSHAMAYDSNRQVTVLFGGDDRFYRGDTWEWDGVEWTLRSQTGPAPRYFHAMAYDSARNVTVLFGGRDGFGQFGDTWEWDGATWSLRSQSGPPPRVRPTMAFDSSHALVVLYGGTGAGSVPLDDTWTWNGSEWKLVAEVGPGARYAHAMVYDSTSGVFVLFGGYDGERRLGDTWTYGCDTLLHLTVIPTCPSGGPIRISWEGATPSRQATLIFALNTGNVAIPQPNPCAGTRLGLGANQIQLVWQGPSGPDGSRTLNAQAPRAACGGYLQLLDIATCATSNVAPIE